MAHLINDYDGRKVGEIMRDVWDYVAGEIAAAQQTETRARAQRKAKRTRCENEKIQEWVRNNI